MKRTILCGLLGLGVVAMTLRAGSLWAAQPQDGPTLERLDEPHSIVNHDGVNVRVAPGLDEVVAYRVDAGTAVKVLGERHDWMRIGILPDPGRIGWIHARFLSEMTLISDPTVLPAEELAYSAAPRFDSDHSPEHNYLQILGDDVRVRADGSVSADVIGHVSRGMLVSEVDRQSDWIKVEVVNMNLTGWIWASFVNAENSQHTSKGSASATTSPVFRRWVVLVPSVEVRDAPNAAATVRTTLKRGEEVVATTPDGVWLRVPTPGDIPGWIPISSVELTDVVAAGAATFIERLKRSQADVGVAVSPADQSTR